MRIAIPEEKKLVHELVIPIRWGDMDVMGHVNNTTYFRYLETIRSSQLAITETEFKVMANGEQIGTLTRPNATLTTNFRQYAASKVWSFRYSYRQQAFDDYGRPKVDEHGKPVYETVEANDPVSVIYLPDGIMQFYAPYTFRGELFGLPNQTVQTFKWQLGPTSASDCYVCTDSFLDIKLVP